MIDRCCEGARPLKFSRRYFLKQGGVVMVGLSAMPAFLQRAVASTPSTTGKKQFVVLFQRGAADGLNIVVPFGEPNYYRLRPSIAIPQPRRSGNDAAIDLDGFFGLHPSLAPLEPLYHNNQLAIVHAAGSPDPTRSHFDAQDFMESGTPGVKATEDGWLNRAIQTIEENASPFRAVAMGPNLPRMLQGSASAIALPDLKQFKVMPQWAASAAAVQGGFEAMYAQTVDHALHGTGTETFEAIDMLRKVDPGKYKPENGAQYPASRLGQSLQQIGQLLKANIGVEVLFVDCGGWDNHVNEGGVQGQLSNLLKDLGAGLAAFHRDMGDRMQDVVVLTMSEFGRTAKENGNRGTDHGHANCMFVMGGDVKGGKVHGRWPGLSDHQLNEGRDLALITDFRLVVGEILTRHLTVTDLKAVFPGFDADPGKFVGLIRGLFRWGA
jgi:uncharacterized protein (DUF1501 family)